MKHLKLRRVSILARGTAEAGISLYEMPPLTFRGRASPAPSSTPEGRWRHFYFSTMSDLSSEEVWEPVPGFKGSYEVSNYGRVRSLRRTIDRSDGTSITVGGKIMSLQENKGYPVVRLRKPSGVRESFKVHHLVAKQFIGDPPGDLGRRSDDYQVDHIDGDKTNNRPDNLRWVQMSDHQELKKQKGEQAKGEEIPSSKLKAEDVREMRSRRKSGESYKSISQDYPACESTCRRAIKKETWQHLGGD